RTSPRAERASWSYRCSHSTCSIQGLTCFAVSPSNRMLALAFRNASICSKFSFSASRGSQSSSCHRLQAHLVLESQLPFRPLLVLDNVEIYVAPPMSEC